MFFASEKFEKALCEIKGEPFNETAYLIKYYAQLLACIAAAIAYIIS